MSEATLHALAEHTKLGSILPPDGGDCEEVLEQFTKAGINIDILAGQLQDEGAIAFARSWNELLECIDAKSGSVQTAS